METAAQNRAARALLDCTARELAKRAGVSVQTVLRWESGGGGAVLSAMRGAIVAALERDGVEFVEGGARLKPKTSD